MIAHGEMILVLGGRGREGQRGAKRIHSSRKKAYQQIRDICNCEWQLILKVYVHAKLNPTETYLSEKSHIRIRFLD